MTELQADVLIVGGGPAGLSVAARLPDGVSSILVHQDAEIGRPVRTSGGTWVSDMRALGVPDDLYVTMNTLEFRSDNVVATHAMKSQTLAVLDITGLYQWLGRAAVANGCDVHVGTKMLACVTGRVTSRRSALLIGPRSVCARAMSLMPLVMRMQLLRLSGWRTPRSALVLALNTNTRC